MLNWLWAVAPPFVLVVLCNWTYPFLIMSVQQEYWLRVLLLSQIVQALLAAWAGWRVVRRHAGTSLAAAIAGGTTQAATFGLIFGLAFATGPFRPAGFQETHLPGGAELAGMAVLALIAAVFGYGGGSVASRVERKHAS